MKISKAKYILSWVIIAAAVIGVIGVLGVNFGIGFLLAVLSGLLGVVAISLILSWCVITIMEYHS